MLIDSEKLKEQIKERLDKLDRFDYINIEKKELKWILQKISELEKERE